VGPEASRTSMKPRRFDPRNVQPAHPATRFPTSLFVVFPEALRKLDQVLNIIPDDVDTLAFKAGDCTGRGRPGRVRRRSSLRSIRTPTNRTRLETQIYQAILERHPAQIIPSAKGNTGPALIRRGVSFNGDLRFWVRLGATKLPAIMPPPRKVGGKARSETGNLCLKNSRKSFYLIGDLALTNIGPRDKAAAFGSDRTGHGCESDRERRLLTGPIPIEILARVAAQVGEPDRAIAALQKLLSTPYAGPLAGGRAAHSCTAPARSDCSIRSGTIRASKSSFGLVRIETGRTS